MRLNETSAHVQVSFCYTIRAALLVALLPTPHCFRSKRQLWAYSGFAVETHDSGEYRGVRGKLRRNHERITVRGLNDNHNKDLKNLFKSAAISASTRPGPLHDFYGVWVAKGMRPTRARLTLARKIAAITFTMRKKTVVSASRLSISLSKRPFYLRELLCGDWLVGFSRCSVRGEYQSMRSALCALAPSHP